MYVRKAHKIKSMECTIFPCTHLPEHILNLVSELRSCSTSESRQNVCAKIVDGLSSLLGLPPCEVAIHDSKRRFVRGSKNHGRNVLMALYTQYHRPHPDTIEIWNRTENGRRLCWFHMLYLLLHEFVHHYERTGLQIVVDHDSGFRQRHKNLWNMATLGKGKCFRSGE